MDVISITDNNAYAIAHRSTKAWLIIYTSSIWADNIFTVVSRLLLMIYYTQISSLLEDLDAIENYCQGHTKRGLDYEHLTLQCKQYGILAVAFVAILLDVLPYTFVVISFLLAPDGVRAVTHTLMERPTDDETIGSLFLVWMTTVTSFVVAGLIVGLGIKLVSVLRGFGKFLQFQITHDTLYLGKLRQQSALTIVENAFRLKKCFKVYARTFGILGGALLVYEGLSSGYAIYCSIWPKDKSTGLPYLLTTSFLSISILSIGNALKNEVEATKRMLERTILTLKLQNSNKELLSVAQMMSLWEWNLTCGNCFNLDSKLHLVFLMTLISSMTFIIQLELSETNKC
ncbi:unnamed protein product [Allacma fusca]|uniref:Uncharacterized protein n=1 Tax=Allacma fusca TaxID=39272 RepID=A0A8J2KBI3_9HEXA|nr:unnamed protein product [Allacma fusca]